MATDIRIRRAVPGDLEAVSRIVYEAFKGIADRHQFPIDFTSIEVAGAMAGMLLNHPSVYGVVAESGGKVVGSNFLDERDAIVGIGPISVDPSHQGRGIGRKLMEAVIERGSNAPGIRLVQESFNTASLSLYASLGFDVVEPLALLRGRPSGAGSGRAEVRPLAASDLDGCAALCKDVHGFDRINELRDALQTLRPFVALREGRVVAYTSAPSMWVLNHGVARTQQDMQDLLLGTAASSAEPIAFQMPTRQADFFRWALRGGMRVIKPMTLMAMRTYRQPAGCYFPSVAY